MKYNACTGSIDKQYSKKNKIVIGIDEAGRGPIAGPMFAGIVSFNVAFDLDEEVEHLGLNDSKKLSEKKRFNIGESVKNISASRIVKIPAEEIDSAVNINDLFDKFVSDELFNFVMAQLGAESLRSARNMLETDCIVLMDGNRKVKGIPFSCQIAQPKLDATSWSVAAASIIAKNAQVEYMKKIHSVNPEYNFGKHKGYGTKEHFEMIKKFGFHKEHRVSWINKDKIK